MILLNMNNRHKYSLYKIASLETIIYISATIVIDRSAETIRRLHLNRGEQ